MKSKGLKKGQGLGGRYGERGRPVSGLSPLSCIGCTVTSYTEAWDAPTESAKHLPQFLTDINIFKVCDEPKDVLRLAMT